MLIDVEIEQAADRMEPLILVIQIIRKLSIRFIVSGPHSVLQLTDGRRVPLVEFAVSTPVKVASNVQREVTRDLVAECQLVLLEQFTLDLLKPDTIQIGAGPCKIFLHKTGIQSDGLETLGAFVALQRRDPHF